MAAQQNSNSAKDTVKRHCKNLLNELSRK